MSALGAIGCTVEPVGMPAAIAEREMRIRRQRERDGVVTKLRAHPHRIGAALQVQRGEGVPQIVEPPLPEFRGLEPRRPRALANVVIVEESTFGVRKYQSIGGA